MTRVPWQKKDAPGANSAPSADDHVIEPSTTFPSVPPGNTQVMEFGSIAGPKSVTSVIVRSVSQVLPVLVITQRTVLRAASSGLDDRIARAREIYRPRRDAMLGALEEYMPEDVTWSHPDGGFFVWITLPEAIDVTTFARAAWVSG